MRIQISLLLGALVLTSCYTSSLTRKSHENRILYSVRLESVERPRETKNRWGEMTRIDLDEKNRYHYEDNMLDSYFLVLKDRIEFEIQNKTEHSIKLIWNEASYIDFGGNGTRIMHEGVKYIDRNAIQPPSVIPARGGLSDVILPTNRVYYREGYYGAYIQIEGGLEHIGLVLPDREILPLEAGITTMSLSDSTRKLAKSTVGQKVGVLLPLEIQGVVNEYTFWFEVTGYQVMSMQNQEVLEQYGLEDVTTASQAGELPKPTPPKEIIKPVQTETPKTSSPSVEIIGEISKVLGNYGLVDLTSTKLKASEGMMLSIYDNQFLLDSTMPKICDVEIIKIKSSVLAVRVRGKYKNQMLKVGQLVVMPE